MRVNAQHNCLNLVLQATCLVLGQNSHWAWLAAATALLLPAVARGANLPSVSFPRSRTGALDLLRSVDLAQSGRPPGATRNRSRCQLVAGSVLSGDHRENERISAAERPNPLKQGQVRRAEGSAEAEGYLGGSGPPSNGATGS